jgi:hypothetical protein
MHINEEVSRRHCIPLLMRIQKCMNTSSGRHEENCFGNILDLRNLSYSICNKLLMLFKIISHCIVYFRDKWYTIAHTIHPRSYWWNKIIKYYNYYTYCNVSNSDKEYDIFLIIKISVNNSSFFSKQKITSSKFKKKQHNSHFAFE